MELVVVSSLLPGGGCGKVPVVLLPRPLLLLLLLYVHALVVVVTLPVPGVRRLLLDTRVVSCTDSRLTRPNYTLTLVSENKCQSCCKSVSCLPWPSSLRSRLYSLLLSRDLERSRLSRFLSRLRDRFRSPRSRLRSRLFSRDLSRLLSRPPDRDRDRRRRSSPRSRPPRVSSLLKTPLCNAAHSIVK